MTNAVVNPTYMYYFDFLIEESKLQLNYAIIQP